MAKIKIYELAKELAVESKDILRKLHKMNLQAKNHMSTISDKEADAIRQEYAAKNAPPGQIVGPGGFIPIVKRIPKAVVQMEQAAVGAEPLAAETAPADSAPPPAEQIAPAAAEQAQGAPLPHIPAAEKTPPPDAAKPAEQAAPAKPGKAAKPDKAAKPGKAAPPGQEAPAAKDAPPAQKMPPRQGGPGQPGHSRPPGQEARKDYPPRRGDGKGQDRPPSKGGFDGRPRPDRPQGQDRPPGKGGFDGRPRPDRPQGQDRPPSTGGRPPAKGGFDGRPRPDRPQGQDRPPGTGGRPPGQGGYGGRPRPPGEGQRPTGGRPPAGNRGRDGRGGLNIPPPAVPSEKPTNYRPPSTKKKITKDQKLDNLEEGGRRRDFRPAKGKKDKPGRRKDTKMIMPPVVPKKIMISETVVLSELAHAMGKTAAEIIKKLFGMGIMATINQELDSETAILLADEYGITVEVTIDKAAEIMEDVEDAAAELLERPPVVTIMGHVDHGKTSLLDAIRHTNVISTEAGGITQHIGAYQVDIKGKKITFLDTPGHEAFTAMRARGAQVTDIAIIVVAADDGVMPQTIEAINHSKAAKVPIIIAINKIDKEAANPDRVKQELTEHGLVCEEWGGETIMVPVSAKGRQNIEGLLEMILLVAEVAELRANPNRQARGTVVESRLDKARGPVVSLLIQKGTLRIGDSLLAGPVFGKVRAMTDDKGRKVRQALPSMPVEVMGFSEVPSAGEIFIAAKDDKDARFVAQRQQIKKREGELRKTARVSLDDLFQRIAQGEIKDLNLVVKADVHGSAEAIQQSLEKLNSETEEVRVNVIHSGVGGISESDVMLATASNAIIIGFNVRPMPAALKAAEQEQVDIRLYRVIYDAIDDIKKAMSGLLAPEFKEQVIGHAEVRAVFKVPKAGMVAGCYVQDGKMIRHAQVRIVRDSVVIADDKIDSLRRFKDDAKEVLTGFECGIGLESFNDVKEGDVIEAFVMEEIKREL